VRRMRLGQLQAALLTVSGLSQIDPSVTALQEMPLVFRSLDEVQYVRESMRPQLERRMLDKGFVVLFWGDAGWVRFFSRQPALHPRDFKNMKMFVEAGEPVHVEMMKSTGYHPVALEWSDALISLQTGMIDAVPTTPFYSLAGQFYLVANHLLTVNWVPLGGAVVITRKAWEGLSPQTQAELRKSAVEAGAQITKRGREENEEAIEAMKKKGLQVHTLTPQLEAEWQKMAEEFYPQIRGRLVPATEFDEVQRLLRQFRAKAKP
jgi:TRAP-type transport system periplasmic protein